jgi:lysophospholipase L1-like esterase
MQWYEDEVRALEQRIKIGPIPRCPVVFYGSSSIRLWSTLASDLDLPNALNLGFGGSTLEACAFFFERLVVPTAPASLIVYAGDNDLGDGRNPENVLTFFRSLAEQVYKRLPGIPFSFISVKPSPARSRIIDRIRRTNDLIRREIRESGTGCFISVFEAMLDERGRPRASLFLEDGLHLSPGGYRVWTDVLANHRNQIFNTQSDQYNPAQISSNQGEARVSQMLRPSA